MKTTFDSHATLALALPFDRALRLPARSGELRVRSGAVWLTRQGDAVDHVLYAGQRLRLRAGDAAVVEAWQRDLPAVVEWQATSLRVAALRALRGTLRRLDRHIGRSLGAALAQSRGTDRFEAHPR